MQKTIIIFMSLEVGGRGEIGFRIIRNIWDCDVFTVLEVNRREAAGLIMSHNHKKCMGRF